MIGEWLRKCKRRNGGVYVWRTRRHGARRRHFAYVGETDSFARRERDQRGLNVYRRANGSTERSKAMPWIDLDAKRYCIIHLPWWLCWKWVRRPLETVVILLLWPVYNHQKNQWNPRRISLWMQGQQRAARDYGRRWS